MTIRIETYSSPEPGPRQWVAVLEARVHDQAGKLSGPVCMNFWAGTRAAAKRAAEAFVESEQEKYRRLEEARQRARERMQRPIEEDAE